MVLPVVGGFMFLLIAPARFHQSGFGEFIASRITPSVLVFGGMVAVASVAACVESFRRGSFADRFAGAVACLFTLSFLTEFFSLMLLPVRPSPV